MRAGEVAHLARRRGGEEQRLPLLRQPAQDPVELRLEAHVEHPVRLVEHEHLDALEVGVALREVVDEPPGRRDDDLAAFAERLRLPAHADAADDHGATHAPAVAEALELLADLQGELTRRRENERPRPDLAGEPFQDRQEERGGLAGAGRGGADDVPAFERRRDGLCLDGGRMLEPGALQRAQRLTGQLQICERRRRRQQVLLAYGAHRSRRVLAVRPVLYGGTARARKSRLKRRRARYERNGRRMVYPGTLGEATRDRSCSEQASGRSARPGRVALPAARGGRSARGGDTEGTWTHVRR